MVGFDSAWTAKNSGAIGAVLTGESGDLVELSQPVEADFCRAMDLIKQWQCAYHPTLSFILIDQPTIVRNFTGQREVEAIACAAIIRRGGCMQPANSKRDSMFGLNAPIWKFVGCLNARTEMGPPWEGTFLLETYPTMFFISRGWILPCTKGVGRLPKYNPLRRKTFSLNDWKFVCNKVAESFDAVHLNGLSGWARWAQELKMPRKNDQDRLDACLCLLAAIDLGSGADCLVVGDGMRGCLVVPESQLLREELSQRCRVLGLDSRQWLRVSRVGPVRGLESKGAVI